MTSNYYLDINVVQPLPPNNINRDDTGTPKTARYGGVVRARISSQALKRAVRRDFRGQIDSGDLGRPTREVVNLIADAIGRLDPEIDAVARAKEVTELLLGAQKSVKDDSDGSSAPRNQYLVFLSNHQVQQLAELAVSTEGKLPKKDVVSAANSNHGIELSLFGRMVADAPELTVDASVQVAHAISTHQVELESDYFTAVDEFKPEDSDKGAGMIGEVGFSSSTMYRYATLGLSELLHNLGDVTAAGRAARAFVRSFVMSMPTGKQNSFANVTVPDAVLVVLRRGRSISLAGAFENPVRSTEGGFVRASCERLADYEHSIEDSYSDKPVAALLIRTDAAGGALDELAERVTLDEMIERVEAAAVGSLGDQS